MTFAQLPSQASVFVDANTLVYHFQPHPTFGASCTALVKRIELQDLTGFTAAHVMAELGHRLMMIEAATQFGWTSKAIQKLRNKPSAIQQLSKFQQALAEVPLLGIQVLPITGPLLQTEGQLARQLGLLMNDALIVAVMQAHGLTNIASADPDFNTIPGITRYSPA